MGHWAGGAGGQQRCVDVAAQGVGLGKPRVCAHFAGTRLLLKVEARAAFGHICVC